VFQALPIRTQDGSSGTIPTSGDWLIWASAF